MRDLFWVRAGTGRDLLGLWELHDPFLLYGIVATGRAVGRDRARGQGGSGGISVGGRGLTLMGGHVPRLIGV